MLRFKTWGLFIFFIPQLVNAFALTSDIEYDQIQGLSLRLDVYAPSQLQSSRSYPAIVYMHGGCYNEGSKKDITGELKNFADKGFIIFSVDYRSSNLVKYPAGVEDIQQALRFIRKNAARFHADPNRMVSYGESAGGYLAAILGVRVSPDRSGKIDAYSKRVNIVIDWYGRTDFTRSQSTGTDCAESFLGLTRNAVTMPQFAAASVMTDVNSQSADFLIIHGTEDQQVDPIHSILLAESLWKAGRAAKLVFAQGKGHAFLGGDEWKITAKYLSEAFRVSN